MTSVSRQYSSSEFTKRSAATATEFAVLLPFILTMLFFTVDYCRVFYYTQILQTSAYAGALHASQIVRGDPNANAVDDAVQAALREGSRLQPPLQKEQVQVEMGAATATVTIAYEYRTVFSFLGLPRTVNINKRVVLARAPGTQEQP